MTLEIRYFQEALDELDAAVTWYRKHRPAHVGERFLQEVSEAILLLAEFPKTYPVSRFDPRVRVRHLPGVRYSIIYDAGDAIMIVAIAHTSRRQGYWLDRLR